MVLDARYALDACKVRYQAARAPTDLSAVLLLNRHNDLSITPDVSKPIKEWTEGPTILCKTDQLLAAIAMYGQLSRAAVALLQVTGPGTIMGGVGAVQIPYLQFHPPSLPLPHTWDSGTQRRRKRPL